MAESGIKSYFPSQTVSDAETLSYEYGLKVGKAIQQEWFYTDSGTNRYRTNFNNFHNLRLYARGEQSIYLSFSKYDQAGNMSKIIKN